ncbi:MAG: LysR family transcriptional regulator substrate-binding protein, partial [Gemmatimonadetes bacterium]|nr:LysR family transcriptional regulator substrate-binding protein [Gemmatimonadota bacterium]
MDQHRARAETHVRAEAESVHAAGGARAALNAPLAEPEIELRHPHVKVRERIRRGRDSLAQLPAAGRRRRLGRDLGSGQIIIEPLAPFLAILRSNRPRAAALHPDIPRKAIDPARGEHIAREPTHGRIPHRSLKAIVPEPQPKRPRFSRWQKRHRLKRRRHGLGCIAHRDRKRLRIDPNDAGQRFRGLTAEGERIVEWARRILADRDALRQEVGSARQGMAGRLTIGAIPTALAGAGLLTAPFLTQHPRVRIRLLSLSSMEIQRGLDNFDLDAGITYLDNEPLLRVRTVPLYRERYFLVTADRSLFRGRASATWAEAADVPLCLLTADMQNRRIIDAIFHEAGHATLPRVESNSILGIYAHIRGGAMASVLTQAALYLLGMPRWLRALP